MRKLSPEFWSSRTTIAGLSGIVASICTVVFHRPEWLPLVAAITGFAQIAFGKDTIAAKLDENTAMVANATEIAANRTVAASHAAVAATKENTEVLKQATGAGGTP